MYVIADKRDGKLDWDGELHPSIDACIESMCGQSQSYVRTEEEATDEDRTVWSEDYEIRRVLPLTGNAEPSKTELAEAFDWGVRNGQSRALRRMSDQPDLPLEVANPYREFPRSNS